MKKGTAITFAAGVFAGIILSGPAAQAATNLTATLSSQPIYVNGQRVTMTAYAIAGHNYVKLRDIGQAVDFGVIYDAATNSVYIDSGAPYQEDVSQPAQASSAPSVITEEGVYTAIRALRNTYPTNTWYGTFYRSTSNGPYGMAPTHCAGWATLCSDAAFGDLPWRRIVDPNWEDIRPGDLIQYDNASGGHVIVVLEKTDEYVKVTESGTNNKARWGGQYFRWWLEEQTGYVCYTRYPQ